MRDNWYETLPKHLRIERSRPERRNLDLLELRVLDGQLADHVDVELLEWF